MPQYSAGWITVPGKGRRWRTAEGEYLSQRPAGGLPGLVGALQSALTSADRRLGGWLPGGGTASPATKVVQSITPAAKQVASGIRDQALVPLIDAGIGSGVLPAKEAMFARYLTGTSKPLTAYPGKLTQKVSDAFDSIAIEQTRDEVDDIFRKGDPLHQQYAAARQELGSLQTKLRDRAEVQGQASTAEELSSLDQLEGRVRSLERSMGVTPVSAMTGGSPKSLSDKERLAIINKHGLASPGDVTVGFDAAYGVLPDDVALSLGRFTVRGGVIHDRYKFDNLQDGRRQLEGRGSVYPDAAGGGKLASDLIELGLKSGIVNPGSGYDIRVPLRGR